MATRHTDNDAGRARLIKGLLGAQEAERKRIAGQLHDELAQSLTALLLSLDAAEDIMASASPAALHQLDRTRDVVARALEQTRRLILDLRPSMLDDLGLVPAIRWYADTHLSPTGAVIVFTTEGVARRLAPEVEASIFRIAQEAMANVIRHARAAKVNVRLDWEPEGVVLTVADDGRGFDPASIDGPDASGAGLGILGMQERTAILGGTLSIDGNPGRGTCVTLRLPAGVGEGRT